MPLLERVRVASVRVVALAAARCCRPLLLLLVYQSLLGVAELADLVLSQDFHRELGVVVLLVYLPQKLHEILP